jgi:hypothetical protein
MLHDAAAVDPETALYWPLTAFGVKASHPSFDVTAMLTPVALARYDAVTTKGCWYYAYAALKEIGHRPAVKPGWQTLPEVRLYNREAYSGDKPIKGPLMVLAGDDDQSVAIANIKVGVERACRNGLDIEFAHRPGLDHDPLMEKTTPLQLAWTHDRLTGQPWAGNCGR